MINIYKIIQLQIYYNLKEIFNLLKIQTPTRIIYKKMDCPSLQTKEGKEANLGAGTTSCLLC